MRKLTVWDFADAYVEAKRRGDTDEANRCLAAIDCELGEAPSAAQAAHALATAQERASEMVAALDRLAELTEQRDTQQALVSRIRIAAARDRLHDAIAAYGVMLRSEHNDSQELTAHCEVVVAREAYIEAYGDVCWQSTP